MIVVVRLNGPPGYINWNVNKMGTINAHGLGRHIPEPTARIVRQECGFGCAICGAAIVIYHHFDPPFEDAREHSPQGIILLCPTCHTKFGHLPAERMREYRQSPRCRKAGFTRDDSLFGFQQVPRVELGQITATGGHIIRHRDRVLLGLCGPEEDGGPLRLTCELVDDRDVLMLGIRDNEVTIGIDHFDVKWESNVTELYIRRKLRDIVLRMTTNRVDTICITHLAIGIAGGRITCTPGKGLAVQAPSGGCVSVAGRIIGDIGIWITDENMCLLGVNPHGGAGAAQRWQ